jgi:hypothetical protein
MADNRIATKRKLTGAAFQSLDGVIQGGGGPDEDIGAVASASAAGSRRSGTRA